VSPGRAPDPHRGEHAGALDIGARRLRAVEHHADLVNLGTYGQGQIPPPWHSDRYAGDAMETRRLSHPTSPTNGTHNSTGVTVTCDELVAPTTPSPLPPRRRGFNLSCTFMRRILAHDGHNEVRPNTESPTYGQVRTVVWEIRHATTIASLCRRVP
jgi:hypothetical protein